MDFESLIPILLVIGSVIISAVKNGSKEKQQNKMPAGADLSGKDNNKQTDKKYRRTPQPAKSIFDEMLETLSNESYSPLSENAGKEIKTVPVDDIIVVEPQRKKKKVVKSVLNQEQCDNTQVKECQNNRLTSILKDKSQLKSAFVLSEVLKCKF